MTLRELIIGVAVAYSSKGAKEAESDMNKLMNQGNALIGTFAKIGAALGIAFTLDGIRRTSDELTKFRGRINLITKDAEETKRVMEKLFDASFAGGVAADPLMDLFASAGLPLSSQGFSNDQIAQFAETLTQLSYVSGLDNNANEALIRNLNQALGAGTFAGKDFSDINRIGGSPVLRQFAKGLGMTFEDFKQAASDGKIASKDIMKAVQAISGEVREQFNTMPKTIEGAFARIQNAWSRLIFKLQETGAFEKIAMFFNKIADGMLYLVKNIEKLKTAFKLLAIVVGSLALAFGLLKLAALAKDFRFLMFAVKFYTVTAWRAAAATLAAAWPLLLLAAAIALVVLIIEDLYVWMNGGDSLIGQWLGPWEEYRDSVLAWWKEIKESIIEIWEFLKPYLIGWVKAIAEGIRLVLGIIVSLINGDLKGAFEGMKNYLKLVLDSWKFFGDKVKGILSDIGQAILDLISKIPGLGGISDFVNGLGKTNLGLGGIGMNLMPRGGTNTFTSEINITAPNSSPAAIGNATTEAMGRWWDTSTPVGG